MTKEGMRGFAAGILMTTAILAFFYYQVLHIPAKTAAGDLSQDSVNHYLSEHQLVAMTKQDYAELKDAASQPEQKTQSKPAPTTPEKTTSDPTNVIKASIEIKSGMATQDVAAILKKDHIIKDEHAFNDYLQKHNLMKYVQIGKFNVSSNMSIAELAKVITKK